MEKETLTQRIARLEKEFARADTLMHNHTDWCDTHTARNMPLYTDVLMYRSKILSQLGEAKMEAHRLATQNPQN
jgi:L-ascorbate metabolism protein UlaG (beta-lactamase superfamily)